MITPYDVRTIFRMLDPSGTNVDEMVKEAEDCYMQAYGKITVLRSKQILRKMVTKIAKETCLANTILPAPEVECTSLNSMLREVTHMDFKYIENLLNIHKINTIKPVKLQKTYGPQPHKKWRNQL